MFRIFTSKDRTVTSITGYVPGKGRITMRLPHPVEVPEEFCGDELSMLKFVLSELCEWEYAKDRVKEPWEE